LKLAYSSLLLCPNNSADDYVNLLSSSSYSPFKNLSIYEREMFEDAEKFIEIISKHIPNSENILSLNLFFLPSLLFTGIAEKSKCYRVSLEFLITYANASLP